MTRPVATGLVLLAITAGLSGCGMFSERPAETADPDHQVIVTNADSDAHNVTVELYRNGELRQTHSSDVEPRTDWEVTREHIRSNYTIVTRTESGMSAVEEFELPLVEGDRRSYTLIRITEAGEVETETIWED